MVGVVPTLVMAALPGRRGRRGAADGCDVWVTGYWAIYNGAGGWDVYENIIERLGPPAAACPADTGGDGVVDVADLLTVLGAWGTAEAAADVTGDGMVDVSDLLMVMAEWGVCP